MKKQNHTRQKLLQQKRTRRNQARKGKTYNATELWDRARDELQNTDTVIVA